MRHFTVCALLLGIALLLPAPAPAQSDTVTILYINDSHSSLAPLGPRGPNLDGKVGGIARAATVIRREQGRNAHPILLHAGDFSVGDIFFNVFLGVPELRILKDLGCDAMAVGNHEWDLGPLSFLAELDSAFAERSFPLLTANTRLNDSSIVRLKKFITPSAIVRAGGLKVGVFGLTTPLANSLSSPGPAVVDTPFSYAAAAVASLRKEGCRPIIAVSHLGYLLDRALAMVVPGIDLIVGGHDHRSFKRPVPIARGEDTTWVVQTSGFYREIGMIRLVVTDGKVRVRGSRVIPVNSSVPEAPDVAAGVRSLTKAIEDKYGKLFTERIGRAGATLKEEELSLFSPGYHDTPVGNLVADAFRDLTGTEMAIEPGGSTAQEIHAGPILPIDLFRVVGYGFNPVNGLGYHLMRFNVQGEALIAGINYSLSTIAEDDEFFLQVSGIRYSYDPSAPPSNRLISATVHGRPVDPSRTYSVTANAFVAGFMKQVGVPLTDLYEFGGDTTEFMALCRHVAKLGTLQPKPHARILSVGERRQGGASMMPSESSGKVGR